MSVFRDVTGLLARLAVMVPVAIIASIVIAVIVGTVWDAVGVPAHEPAPHNRVATVGDGIEVYRIGVPTADGRVAECLVTSLGGIHCFDQVEDAW